MQPRKKTGFESLAKDPSLYTQESPIKVKNKNSQLFIGIPKETALQENRIPLTPEAVALLVNNGHEVWVETCAGNGSKFADREYSEAGAKIVYSTKEVFEADIVLKIEPPSFEEIDYIKPGKTLISALQLVNQTVDYIHALNKKRITAIGFELIEDKEEEIPAIRAMSEIVGSTVMLIAAEYLSNVNDGKGIILGGITGVPPTKVVIIGSGTVAEFAARAALGLGAQIQIFDDHIYKLRRIKHTLGHQIYTSTINASTLANTLKDADVVIGAIRAEKGRNKCIVTEEMVSQMKPNTVIIDVSIDQGGCIETSEITTHQNPTFKKYDVIHYCVPNIASRVARTATTAFSNILTPILMRIADNGGLEEMMFSYEWFRKGVYTYKGNLTNASVARKLNLTHKALEIIMAGRF